MTSLTDYQESYRHVRLTRGDDGILVVRLHTDDGPLVWSGSAHEELGRCFRDIASDRGNQVVVIIGTGESFIASSDAASFAYHQTGMNPAAWDEITQEGRLLLMAYLDIAVPVIVAVNGPATVHSELAALGDLTYATPDVVFRDTHCPRGMVPGDGVHVVWPELLGPARSRQFLLLGRGVEVDEAVALGLVSEVVPRSDLLAKAMETAAVLLQQSELCRRNTRELLTRPMRQRLSSELAIGLALEGAAHPGWR